MSRQLADLCCLYYTKVLCIYNLPPSVLLDRKCGPIRVARVRYSIVQVQLSSVRHHTKSLFAHSRGPGWAKINVTALLSQIAAYPFCRLSVLHCDRTSRPWAGHPLAQPTAQPYRNYPARGGSYSCPPS